MSTITRMITQLLLWPLLTQCILAETDCYWVTIIYGKMGGDISQIPLNCCNMPGVSCDEGRIAALNWDNQGLSGSVPPEIGNLKNLRLL